MNIEDIKQTVGGVWERYKACYAAHLDSDVALVGDINRHVSTHGGKELRPLLLLLCAGEQADENSIRLAAAMEMLHNASLMHDDVVDQSDTRRGQPAVNSAWNNSVAVLCGDYYLARVMELIGEVGDKEATAIINRTVVSMTQGELMQLSSQESDYYEVIYRKTGTLMEACCELGRREMKTFGRHFGIAFQLRDDWMDYNQEEHASKPSQRELMQQMEEEIALAQQALTLVPVTRYTEALGQLCEMMKTTNN